MVAKKILWWGRSNIHYSRNQLLRKLLLDLDFEIIDFYPKLSKLGHIEAWLRNIVKPDLVWVPCFRHRDIKSASIWCKKNNIPLLIDPLISSWNKKILENSKYNISSIKSVKLKKWESTLFSYADLVLADTEIHLNLFKKYLNVPKDKLSVVYVGADTDKFKPDTQLIQKNYIEVLFYGSFIGLHGADIIVEAAKLLSKYNNVIWTMLGDGPEHENCLKISKGAENIQFEKSISYEDLPKRINEADIILGVFGDSLKASSVIPNKVFQGMACGKTIITRKSLAYPASFMSKNSGVIQIPPNDSIALSKAVKSLADNTVFLAKSSLSAKRNFDRFFSQLHVSNQLIKSLRKISIS
tara:strand:+ start:653 stop:1714 length:1062 start_codon:yes stop_codon:yes gene_type:complete